MANATTTLPIKVAPATEVGFKSVLDQASANPALARNLANGLRTSPAATIPTVLRLTPAQREFLRGKTDAQLKEMCSQVANLLSRGIPRGAPLQVVFVQADPQQRAVAGSGGVKICKLIKVFVQGGLGAIIPVLSN